MCLGVEEAEAVLDLFIPLLKKVAAKDAKGKPYVGRVGTRGGEHYTKMIHNGMRYME